MAFVPEGQADSSQARSAWLCSLDISTTEMVELRTTLTVGERLLQLRGRARQSVQSIGVPPVFPRAPASIPERRTVDPDFRDGIVLENRGVQRTKRSLLRPGLGCVAVGAETGTQAGLRI
jgi:hypothetical protein